MKSIPKIILVGVGVIINMKLYKNVSNESHQEKGKVIQRIMKTYALVQTIALPCLLLGHLLLEIDQTFYSLFHPCLALWASAAFLFFVVTTRLYLGFNSLAVAVCRYLFIVYDQQIAIFGVQKFKRLIIGISLWVPVVMALLQNTTMPNSNAALFPLPATILSDNNHSCLLPKFYHSLNKLPENVEESLMYTLAQNYLSPLLISFFRSILAAATFIIFSNIIEGILYTLTFRHMKRCVTFNLQ